MTYDERALELYRLALSLVDAKGRFVTVGLLTYKEFRGGQLRIRYLPSSYTLDIWQRQKVLMVTRRHGVLKVGHFVPGEWEAELEALTTRPLKN